MANPTTMRQLLGLRTRLPLWLVLMMVTCLSLAAVYVWSRGGQTTVVRIDVRGKDFTTYVDGRMAITKTFENAAEQGAIFVQLNPTSDHPELPAPNGITGVTIRDLGSGDIVFRDSFSAAPDDSASRVVKGKVRTRAGAWEPDATTTILQMGDNYRDFSLEVRLANVTSASIGIRASDPGTGVFLLVRPFRLIDSSLSLLRDGRVVEIATMGTLQMQKGQTLRAIGAMATRPLPLVGAALLGAMVIVSVLATLPRPKLPAIGGRYFSTARRLFAPAAVAGLATFALVTTAVLLRGPAEGVPHVPDEPSYMYQAQVLASGRFSEDLSRLPVPELVKWNSVVVHHGRLASMYPPIHPLMLAIGILFHAMWLVPPIIGAACVVLLYQVGRQSYGRGVGLVAALLFAVSPFFLMTASNFMSHNTCALFFLAALLCLTQIPRRPVLFAPATGFLIGMVFATRPLTGLAIIPAFALFLAADMLPSRTRLDGIRRLAGVAAGGIVALAGYLLYQWMATGSPFTVESVQGGSDAFGFRGAHTLAVGLSHEQTQMAHLLLVLQNWAPAIGLALVFVPFILGTTNRWDWFFLVCALAMMAAYTLYGQNGLMHGPRYWYETTPLLMLLSARGIAVAGERLEMWANRFFQALSLEHRSAVGVGYAVVAVPVLILALNGSRQWLFGRNTSWEAEFVPNSAHELRGFNGIDGRVYKSVKAANLHNALVITDECGAWQCYGSTYWLNSPTFDADVVYARELLDRPDLTAALLAAYADRRVYHIDYGRRVIEPYSGPGLGGGPKGLDQAPLAGDVLAALTKSHPAVSLQDAKSSTERDATRMADLTAIAAALEQYAAANKVYPSTGGKLQTLCYYDQLDTGCLLRTFLSPLPSDPLGKDNGYWIVSTQTEFLIIAKWEESRPPPDGYQCKDLGVRPTAGPLICARGPK